MEILTKMTNQIPSNGMPAISNIKLEEGQRKKSSSFQITRVVTKVADEGILDSATYDNDDDTEDDDDDSEDDDEEDDEEDDDDDSSGGGDNIKDEPDYAVYQVDNNIGIGLPNVAADIISQYMPRATLVKNITMPRPLVPSAVLQQPTTTATMLQTNPSLTSGLQYAQNNGGLQQIIANQNVIPQLQHVQQQIHLAQQSINGTGNPLNQIQPPPPQQQPHPQQQFPLPQYPQQQFPLPQFPQPQFPQPQFPLPQYPQQQQLPHSQQQQQLPPQHPQQLPLNQYVTQSAIVSSSTPNLGQSIGGNEFLTNPSKSAINVQTLQQTKSSDPIVHTFTKVKIPSNHSKDSKPVHQCEPSRFKVVKVFIFMFTFKDI